MTAGSRTLLLIAISLAWSGLPRTPAITANAPLAIQTGRTQQSNRVQTVMFESKMVAANC